MSQEEQFRQLQAEMERRAHPPSEHVDQADKRPFNADLKVTLNGRDFPLRPGGGLISLFRYVSRGTQEHSSDSARGMAQLAAMYDLLKDSVAAADWPAFERHATASKATDEDVEPCIRQLIEAYTARPYWPGIRLLAGAAQQMAELDGAVLMGTGRGIASFSAREVCNLQLARLLAAQPGPDERDLLMEELYLDYSPTDIALSQVHQMIAAKAKLAAEEAERGTGPENAEGAAAEDHGDSALDHEAGGPAADPGGPEQPEPG